MSEKIVQLYEEVIKSQLKELVRGSVEETLNELLEAEPEKLTRAARYERNEQRQGYRSGHYNRNLTTTSGDVTLKVPKLKGISFETAIVERYRRRESSVEEALIEMYLAGVSVRRVEDITEALWDSKVSPSTISELNKKAYVHIEDWRNRSLQGGRYPYVYVDGIYLRRNWGGEFENIAILVAIAVNEDGYREVLGAAEGMKEDKASWVSFFQWLRGCGLDGVKLIVGDKCLGMLEAVGEVFSEGKYQRCTLPHRGKASESVPPICSCVHLNLHNDFINLGSQNFLRGPDLGALGVERHNVDLLPGVLGLHIGGDREVILLPGNLLVTGQMGEVGLLGAAGESVYNTVDVLGCQLRLRPNSRWPHPRWQTGRNRAPPVQRSSVAYTQRSHRPESDSRGQRPKSSVRLARICFSGLLESFSLPIHLRSPAGLCCQSDRKGCKLTEQPDIDGSGEGHFHLVAELDFSGVAP